MSKLSINYNICLRNTMKYKAGLQLTNIWITETNVWQTTPRQSFLFRYKFQLSDRNTVFANGEVNALCHHLVEFISTRISYTWLKYLNIPTTIRGIAFCSDMRSQEKIYLTDFDDPLFFPVASSSDQYMCSMQLQGLCYLVRRSSSSSNRTTSHWSVTDSKLVNGQDISQWT